MKRIEPPKRRNPVASNSHVNRAQTHTDRKKAAKAGTVKHKGKDHEQM